MRRRAALFLLLTLGLLWPAGARASDDRVHTIVVRSLGGPLQEDFVRAHLSLRTGEPLRAAAVGRDVKALLGTGRFSDVRIEYEERDEGLIVVVSVRSRLRLDTPIAVEGQRKFREARIREWMGIGVGDYFDEAVLALGAERVRQEYRKAFYPDPEIDWTVVPVSVEDGRAGVRLRVEEGDKARVRRFDFQGNARISDTELSRAVRRYRWFNPFSWWRGVKADRVELDALRRTIREYYLERGHLDVRVREPYYLRDAEGRAVVAVPIEEGAAYRVGATDVSGVTLFPVSELRAQLDLKPGEVAAISRLRANAQSLEDYYGSRGYAAAQANPALETDPATGIVAVRYELEEGTLTSLRMIHVRGNARTRDKVIRREVLTLPGDAYNSVKIRTSERRLQNLGYFSRVASSLEAVPDDAARSDLVFEVEERRTGNVVFGAGFSSVDNLIGFVEVSQGNFDIASWPFTGAGQKINLRAQFGSKRRDYSLSFTEPWFLDRKLSFGFDLFDRDRELEGYSVSRTGGALRLGRPLTARTRGDLEYRIESSRVRDSSNTNEWFTADGDSFFFSTEQEAKSSTLEARWTWDTRDRVFTPSRGQRLVAAARVAGGALGLETDLYGVEVRAEQYFRLWKEHVLAFRLRAESIEEFGDTDELLLFDRLYAGGGRTIRGFDYRDVGPKVVQRDAEGNVIAHRPIGGRTMAAASMEYIVPLADALRLAAFVDIGGAWEASWDVDADAHASSYGLELRLDIPQFPIRIFYADPIRKDDPLTDLQHWGFWIGF